MPPYWQAIRWLGGASPALRRARARRFVLRPRSARFALASLGRCRAAPPASRSNCSAASLPLCRRYLARAPLCLGGRLRAGSGRGKRKERGSLPSGPAPYYEVVRMTDYNPRSLYIVQQAPLAVNILYCIFQQA